MYFLVYNTVNAMYSSLYNAMPKIRNVELCSLFKLPKAVQVKVKEAQK